MKLYILLLILLIQMHSSIGATEIHKECVPVCGRAFLFTKQYPNYYEKKIEAPYEKVKEKDQEVVYETIWSTITRDSDELGRNRFYFRRCIQRECHKKEQKDLEKYAKCRSKLTPEMQEVASKNLATYIPDSEKGLEAACAKLKEKYKETTGVKNFESCLKQ